MVYQGNASDIIPYLERMGIAVPTDQNPCDFFMDLLQKDDEDTTFKHSEYQKNEIDL